MITFDDGYRSVFENALPVLEDLGWPGVLNLKVDNVGAPWGSRSGTCARSWPPAGSSGRTRSPMPTCNLARVEAERVAEMVRGTQLLVDAALAHRRPTTSFRSSWSA